jgi:formate hydrogenlyase transcriptional activator
MDGMPEGARVRVAGDERYRSLLEVTDLIAVHSDIDRFLPDLAACLRAVVDFDGMGVVLGDRTASDAVLFQILLDETDGPASYRLEATGLPPIPDTTLAALWGTQSPVVVHSLDEESDYPELTQHLRKSGHHSFCVLPLTTSLRPVGLLGFASAHVGAYDESDLVFLQRVASHVAIAIDNVRHHQEAAAYHRQLEADRDYWRSLLEVNNDLVTKLDLASLLAAITPSLRRMVLHDVTGLQLHEAVAGPGLSVFDGMPQGLAELLPSIRPEDTPFGPAVMLGESVETEVGELSWLPPAIRKQAEATGMKRLCIVPIATPRRQIGSLMLSRRAPDPFTPLERERARHAAGQVAIAIENALAFTEIAALKDRLARENVYLEDEIRGKQRFEEIIGDSKALQRVLAQVRSVAPTDTAVLLLGETGTGKELIARAIHSGSPRQSRALVTVNCATSPSGLLESEWFGHEKGAFTGAVAQKTGRFELAHQGTLFLDEVGDVPLDLQPKLLRALQQHEIERLGSTRTIRVDFRLVAATNRDLEEMVADREYRADLYYRLNVFPIRLPPLRDRREDIPPLVRYFVQLFAKQLKRNIDSVARESMDALCRWHWPGNIRELQNVIERAVILCQGPTLRVPVSEFEQASAPAAGRVLTLEDAEREHILRALDDTGWVIGGPNGAALRLGVKRTTLVSTMRRLGIVRPRPTREHRRG